MLHRPILRGRLGKWAYALIEYDLVFESLKAMKGQVMADFIVEHWVDVEHDDNVSLDTNFISCTSWKLYFDGSACSSGQGIGIVIISPNGDNFEEASSRLNCFCTNNQTVYEALLFGLEILASMKVRYVEAFGDSLLIVQQVSGECQCLEGSLNTYLDKCLDVIKFNFDEFCIHHISRHENCQANNLAQGASGYNVQRKNFHVKEKLMLGSKATLFCIEPDGPITTPAGQTTTQDGQTATQSDQTARVQGGAAAYRSRDWNMLRMIGESQLLIICEIEKVDKDIRRIAFMFTLINDELYRHTAKIFF
jgi:ribonuclease HI